MFYPQAMTEIELIVPARDLLAVTKVLGSEGVFQQADSGSLGLDNSRNSSKGDNTWHERASAYASLERRIQVIMQALEMDEVFPPAAADSSSNNALDNEAMVNVEVIRPIIEQIESEVRSVSDQLANEHKHLEQLESMLKQVEPVADLDLDVSLLRNPRYLFSVLGTMPTENIDRMQTSLSRVPHVFLPLRQEANQSIVWVGGDQRNSDILDRATRSAYLNPISLPDNYHGTPAQIITSLREDIEKTRQHIAELEKELVKQCERHEKHLQELLWQVRTSRMLADAILRFGKLQYTYLIVGWIPTRGMDDLTTRLKQVSKETLIQASPLERASNNADVPVSLHNPRIMRPFQTLVTTYARPKYNELDPTFLIAITFPLLYGAMFGDVGQGLVLAALGALLSSRRVKALNSLAGLGGLITACGLVATVFGFLYGSFFGIENLLPALWIRPMENIMEILILAIGAGIVLLVAGFLIGIFNAWVARDWGHLLFDRNGLAGFLLYLSLLGFVGQTFTHRTIIPTPILLVVAAICGVLIMFSELLKRLIEGHRPLIVEGVATYGIQAFFELFETLISFLSNSLSYVRVGAFAVAHAGLSSVIFILAQLANPGHGIGYIIVVILGNIFIIGFEGLIVGIQTMRLEYYEFFSKFFKGGGSNYQPLTIRPVEVDNVKQ